jgi:hypothetical protein
MYVLLLFIEWLKLRGPQSEAMPRTRTSDFDMNVSRPIHLKLGASIDSVKLGSEGHWREDRLVP